MKNYIKLIRIHQWVKNSFIFIPAFFSGDIFDLNVLILLVGGFISFSLLASSVYILNDYNDIKTDRAHPQKKYRPLASGKIKPAYAFVVFVIFIICGFTLAFFLSMEFFTVLGLYFGLNLGYSLGLKHIAILDILIIALGFLFRTISGGIIPEIEISQWLIVMVFLLALFLALARRWDDIVLFMETGKVHRKSTQYYNLDFANSTLTMLSGVIIVAYMMYTLSPEVVQHFDSGNIYFTSIFVVAGILRYLQIIMVEKKGGYPTRILYKDPFIWITLLGWGGSFFLIIYM